MDQAALQTANPALNDWDTLSVRVYFEDTDAQGIVYFANYLRFMERGRTEWLRSRGIEQERLRQEDNLCFSLVKTAVKFVRPARFDDCLTVRTLLTRKSGARVNFDQAVHRADGSDELLCTAECEVACITADTFRPRRIPAGYFD